MGVRPIRIVTVPSRAGVSHLTIVLRFLAATSVREFSVHQQKLLRDRAAALVEFIFANITVALDEFARLKESGDAENDV